MNDDTDTHTGNAPRDPAGEAAVWHVAGESGPLLVALTPDAAAVADVRLVDAALRALAAAEAPDAVEVRRMRDAAIRTTRLHAVEAMARGTLSPPTRRRPFPKWPLATAAAALVAVGLVAWLMNTAPSGVQRIANVDSEERRREDLRNEIQEYFPLVSAFVPVELSDAPPASTFDELDLEVDALTVLGEQAAED